VNGGLLKSPIKVPYNLLVIAGVLRDKGRGDSFSIYFYLSLIYLFIEGVLVPCPPYLLKPSRSLQVKGDLSGD